MNLKKYKEKSDSYFVITREEMGPFVSRTAEKIIEFGCGNGAFGKFIKSKINCFYEGVEPMSEFAELAKINLDKINCTTVEYFIENIKITNIDNFVKYGWNTPTEEFVEKFYNNKFDYNNKYSH